MGNSDKCQVLTYDLSYSTEPLPPDTNIAMPTYFVTIAGNIGVGKSTLVSLLSSKLGWEPVMEAVTENPYLADFYADMNRWSFHSQVFFLVRRLQQHHDLLQRPSPILQDRSVYEDAEIFARNLYHQGHLSGRDWMVGDGPTIADFSLSGYLFYPVEESGYDVAAQHPAIGAWVARLRRVPGWADPYEMLPGPRIAPRW